MKQSSQVYLVDDDTDFREATCELLEGAGLTVEPFCNGAEMLQKLDPEWPGVVLCDVRMADLDGFGVLKATQVIASDIPFVMITGHGDVRMAISSIKAGAYDFIEKPPQPDVLISTISRAVGARKLLVENKRLRRRTQNKSGLSATLVGQSQAIREIRAQVLRLAVLPMTVCIFGEPGTGKSVAARALHDYGEGKGEFEMIGCAAASPEEFRSDLAAIAPETATLYLRAVDRLDPKAQAILVEYLKTPGIPRVIVSMSAEAAKAPEQSLTDDLYFLANVARLDMPAIRERGRDVFFLLEVFLRSASQRFSQRLPSVTKDMIRQFERHDWPGNARELQNVAERMVMGLPIGLAARARQRSDALLPYEDAMRQFERTLLSQSLRETGGRKGEAAELLSIPRKRLYLRMKAVGLSDTGQD